jgi:two-component system sensor histidine kinase UhpB
VALCLYRVAQEALRNVAVHAHARRVVVALDKQDGHLMMRVSDDGQGFDPSAVGGAGLGLVSLGERVRMLGGRLDVTAQPGTGTDVVVTLPAER